MYWDKADKKHNAKQKNEAKYLLEDFKKVYRYNKLWHQVHLICQGNATPFWCLTKWLFESPHNGFHWIRENKSVKVKQ